MKRKIGKDDKNIELEWKETDCQIQRRTSHLSSIAYANSQLFKAIQNINTTNT